MYAARRSPDARTTRGSEEMTAGNCKQLGVRAGTLRSLAVRPLVVAFACVVAACKSGGGTGDFGADPDAIWSDTAGDETSGDVPADTTSFDPTSEGCIEDADCDDGDPCTTDSCDVDYGTCLHEAGDADGDGYPVAEVGGTACGGTDCDDTDGDVHPDAPVNCAIGADDDCDTLPDADEDGDGHYTTSCAGGDDCDDAAADVFSGSTAVDCSDMVDHDCNGHEDSDNDGDSYVRAGDCGGNDCDDADPLVHWGAIEDTCNGKDDDCDGELSNNEDVDRDGYPNATCAAAGAQIDCVDSDRDIHPGATESCDAVDQDCDGDLLDAPGADDDADGHLDGGCGGTDCDDVLAGVHPGALEVCDTVDQDCDGDLLDAPGADDDADGFLDESCGGTDCNDAVDLVFPGAPPPCAGVDTNCNGIPEIGLMQSDSPISVAVGDAIDVSVAWTGSEIGASWHDTRDGDSEIYFARITTAGTRMGLDVRVTSATGHSLSPSMVWTGSEYGLSWYDTRDGNYEVYFTRLAPEGTKVGPDVRVTSDGGESLKPDLAWSGSEYGVSWHDNRDGNREVYFARLSPTGLEAGSDTRITNDDAPSYDTALAWSGTEYAVTWYDHRTVDAEIYFCRISEAATKVGPDVRLTNDPAQQGYSDLVWTGSEYGVAWEDDRIDPYVNFEIYLARVSAAGAKIGTETRITVDPEFSRSLSLVWTGSEFGVGWTDYRNGSWEIYFRRISASGTALETDTRVSDLGADSEWPALAWTGSVFGLVWSDMRGGDHDIYSNMTSFCM